MIRHVSYLVLISICNFITTTILDQKKKIRHPTAPLNAPKRTSPTYFIIAMLKLDTRESELFDKCKHLIETNKKWNYIQIRSEMLPLGDVLLFDQAVEAEEETVGAVEAVQGAARPPPREGDGATLGGGNEEWQ